MTPPLTDYDDDDDDGKKTRSIVKHPILRLDVVEKDGSRTSDHRVYCRYQERSVLVGTCCACVHCDEIVDAPTPSVNCNITLKPEASEPDPLGLRTAVGQTLERGAIAIEANTTLFDALLLLREHCHHSIAVVDKAHTVIGVVHESALMLSPELRGYEVAEHMSSRTLAIRENVPVRHALELLAAAHLREAIVVDEKGVPLGIFRDIDGLRWIVLARARARLADDP